MSLLRRRKPEQTVIPEPRPAEPPAPSPRVERALITLTSKMQDCVERLDDIETRLGDLAESVAHAPSHSDVMEVRIHSAKLAAELARATVELRGEIGMASDEARRAARLARSNEVEEVPMSLPVDLDLTTAGTHDSAQDRQSA